MNSLITSSILIPQEKNCQKCFNSSLEAHIVFNDMWFYCNKCQIFTKWSHKSKLENSKLSSSVIERLLFLFLGNKTPSEAIDAIKFALPDEKIHLTTIRRYFTIFCSIVLDYYENQLNFILLENEVEIDESHLFREKKSSAPHRHYKLSSVWLFGAKQRNSSKFFLIPLKNRKEETLIPLIRKHIKIGATIYSDSFSVYVNNKTKQSKLQKYSFSPLNIT